MPSKAAPKPIRAPHNRAALRYRRAARSNCHRVRFSHRQIRAGEYHAVRALHRHARVQHIALAVRDGYRLARAEAVHRHKERALRGRAAEVLRHAARAQRNQRTAGDEACSAVFRADVNRAVAAIGRAVDGNVTALHAQVAVGIQPVSIRIHRDFAARNQQHRLLVGRVVRGRAVCRVLPRHGRRIAAGRIAVRRGHVAALIVRVIAPSAEAAAHATASAAEAAAKPTAEAVRSAVRVDAVIRRGYVQVTACQRNLIRFQALIGGQHGDFAVQHGQGVMQWNGAFRLDGRGN